MKGSRSVIRQLQLTEKGTALSEKANQYIFKVDVDANKMDIKKAVEEQYKVFVAGVNTMNYEGKKRRERTIKYGKRSDWKKAVVRLKEGSKIDLT